MNMQESFFQARGYNVKNGYGSSNDKHLPEDFIYCGLVIVEGHDSDQKDNGQKVRNRFEGAEGIEDLFVIQLQISSTGKKQDSLYLWSSCYD